MAKDAQLYVRVTEEEKAQLEQLAEATTRTQSDMVRWLIRQEWQRLCQNGMHLPSICENMSTENAPAAR